MPASLQRANKSRNAEDMANQDFLDVDSGSNSDVTEAEDKVTHTSNGFDDLFGPAVLVNPGAQASTGQTRQRSSSRNSTGQTRQWSSSRNSTDQDSFDSSWRDDDGLEGGDDSVGRDNTVLSITNHGLERDAQPVAGVTAVLGYAFNTAGSPNDDKFGWDGIDDHQGGEGSDGGPERHGCAGKPDGKLDGGSGHHDWDGWDSAGGHHYSYFRGWGVSEGRCGWDSSARHDCAGRRDCDGGGGGQGWDCDGGGGGQGWNGWSGWSESGSSLGGDGREGSEGRTSPGGGGWSCWSESGSSDWSSNKWQVSGHPTTKSACSKPSCSSSDDVPWNPQAGESVREGASSYQTCSSDWSSNKWHVSGHPATSSAWSKPSCWSSWVPCNPPGGESVGDAASSCQTFSPRASGTTPLVAEAERGSHSARFGNDAFSDSTGHHLLRSDTGSHSARFGNDAFSDTTRHQLVRSDTRTRSCASTYQTSVDKDMADMFQMLENANAIDAMDTPGEAGRSVKQLLKEALLAKTNTSADAVIAAARKLRYENETLPPAMAILQHARNVNRKMQEVDPKFSLTKLTRFHSSATTQVDESECENWLTHQLNMSGGDVPETVKKDLIALTKGLRKQILTNTKFICENGKGTVYKVTYMMKRDGEQAYIALVVFGASFGVDYEMPTTELKEGDAGGLVTAAGEPFAVPASRCGTPAMSGEDIRTFIDYLEGLAAQQIWDQASPAQRLTVESIADSQDAAKAITSASVGLAQEATRAAKLTLVATQETALQVKADLNALQSTCQSAAAESKSNLVAAQESASKVKTDLDALQSTCQSAVAESMETRRKVDALEAATHDVESKVAMLGKQEFYIVTKIHKRKSVLILGKDEFYCEGFVGHVAECGLDCQGQMLLNQDQLSHRMSQLNPPQMCMACFAH